MLPILETQTQKDNISPSSDSANPNAHGAPRKAPRGVSNPKANVLASSSMSSTSESSMGSLAIANETSDAVSTYHRKAKDSHPPSPAAADH